MHNKIPLPTDNIYKFYALFSLVIFIFAAASSLYTNRTTNEQIIALHIELETINSIKNPSSVDKLRKALVERQIEVNRSDKNFYKWGLAILSAFGTIGMIYGFSKWQKEVQPIADEAAQVQLELAKLQLKKLESEINGKNT